MTIATVNPDGTPHQIVIWYLLRGDDVVINSRQGRRWPSNLRREKRANLAIFEGDDAVTLDVELIDSYEGDRAQERRQLLGRPDRHLRSGGAGGGQRRVGADADHVLAHEAFALGIVEQLVERRVDVVHRGHRQAATAAGAVAQQVA